MDPRSHDLALAQAEAASRRLLLRVIDLRFGLEDAAEVVGRDPGAFTPGDLRALRSTADAIHRAIEELAAALWPALTEEKKAEEEVPATAFAP